LRGNPLLVFGVAITLALFPYLAAIRLWIFHRRAWRIDSSSTHT
jgi:hypothetical protein